MDMINQVVGYVAELSLSNSYWLKDLTSDHIVGVSDMTSPYF